MMFHHLVLQKKKKVNTRKNPKPRVIDPQMSKDFNAYNSSPSGADIPE